MPREEELQGLIEEPRGRDRGEPSAKRRNGLCGGGIQVKAELRLEARGAQQAYRVLAKACVGIADDAKRALVDVACAINVIPEMSPSSFSLFGSRIEAMTFHPFEANSFAVARPKPEELPVMKIVLIASYLPSTGKTAPVL